ncbi:MULTISPECIES: hypothetical protein [unclassified Deinococcus]|uniref:hypothetical protein n=1 Tax=unclassified Deinococcus TaxID=2623546 RepID=UPI000C194BAA|nr:MULTISPECIES: hypothetical protein [unclassified Deinococcus]MBX8464863.1 hypothetical protein [Deinococcus sp. RIT780]MCD0162300.1 hypothetical protein [Deinococcus sp. 6YEL10]MCD0171147.1 hypothetical protein [Deinococcus sp. 23YEL01]MCD0177551.1 hypothetical protein [Deinococcus sp. 14RED07]PIG97571.1 hypothetical protein AMD26_012565 [Deinococcus sp. UR1]
MPAERYALAVALACDTIERCLHDAPLPTQERERLHGTLRNVQRTWGCQATLEASLRTLHDALHDLSDDLALAARVSLQNISQWHREAAEPPAPRLTT